MLRAQVITVSDDEGYDGMGQGRTDATSTEDADYGVRLRRRWWVVVGGILLGLAAGYAFTASQQERYTASTSVLVLPTGVSTAGSGARADINMDTEAALVASEQVATAAQGLLGTTTSPRTLLDDLTVTVPSNSQVLTIDYTDLTATSAQAGATAFAQAYLGFRTEEAKREIDAANGAVRADLETATQQLREATDKAAALPANSPDRVYAEAQRSILGNQISTLSARLSALQAVTPTSGQVITAAARPDAPSYPIAPLNLAVGLVAGLLLGFALALLVDRADTRLRHRTDVTRRVGLPVLAEVPASKGPVSLLDADHATTFDRLRNSLEATLDVPGAPLLQVSDAGGAGAGGLVALRLAQAYVRSGGSAVLVVAHPHSPLAAWTGTSDRDGLSEVLRGRAGLEQSLVRVPELPGVRLLPPGRDPELLETLLQAHESRQLLRSLTAGGPVVIDTAGTGESAAAQAIAAVGDGTVVVAERGVAHDSTVLRAADSAQGMGARVAGVVLAARGAHRRERAGETSPVDADGPLSLDKRDAAAVGTARATPKA